MNNNFTNKSALLPKSSVSVIIIETYQTLGQVDCRVGDMRGKPMETNPVLLNKLSMDSDIPLYSQLVSIIKRNISAGTLAPGALLLS